VCLYPYFSPYISNKAIEMWYYSLMIWLLIRVMVLLIESCWAVVVSPASVSQRLMSRSQVAVVTLRIRAMVISVGGVCCWSGSLLMEMQSWARRRADAHRPRVRVSAGINSNTACGEAQELAPPPGDQRHQQPPQCHASSITPPMSLL